MKPLIHPRLSPNHLGAPLRWPASLRLIVLRFSTRFLSNFLLFRPTFKFFSWYTCALGVLCTGTMMLVVDAAMSAIGVVILMILIMVLHYQVLILLSVFAKFLSGSGSIFWLHITSSDLPPGQEVPSSFGCPQGTCQVLAPTNPSSRFATSFCLSFDGLCQ